jgi:Tfp pilus assembly protein PilO
MKKLDGVLMWFIILQILYIENVGAAKWKNRIIFCIIMSLCVQELAYILQVVFQYSCCSETCFK